MRENAQRNIRLVRARRSGTPLPCAGRPDARRRPSGQGRVDVTYNSVVLEDPQASARDQLASLQALTDTAITPLHVDELLDELLSRVQAALDADTAAVLLLAKQGGELIATAARGLEEEVREGVRVPVGSGFAGRIAASRVPIRLDRVDATTVANPILWEKGIKVMLGVPLLATDRVLGVIHVGRLDHRPFTEHDVALLEVVADRVAGAIQSQSLAVERAAAALLERSLLPERLPNPPGFEVAARVCACRR